MTVRAPFNEFGPPLESAGSASSGTLITPGNNTYGSYAQVLSGAQVTDDLFGFWITFTGWSSSGVARDAIAKIAVDTTGAGSFSTSNDIGIDILCSCSGGMSSAGGGGISYFLPVKIKAGSAIGVAGSVNNATVGTGSIFIRALRRPSHPELVSPYLGTFIATFGSTPASSSGTAVTPNASGGNSAWVQLGTAATKRLIYLTQGIGCNNGVISANASSWQLAVGSSTTVNRQVTMSTLVQPGTTETLQYESKGAYCVVNPGDLIFGRAGGQATSPTGMSTAAYGVG